MKKLEYKDGNITQGGSLRAVICLSNEEKDFNNNAGWEEDSESWLEYRLRTQNLREAAKNKTDDFGKELAELYNQKHETFSCKCCGYPLDKDGRILPFSQFGLRKDLEDYQETSTKVLGHCCKGSMELLEEAREKIKEVLALTNTVLTIENGEFHLSCADDLEASLNIQELSL